MATDPLFVIGAPRSGTSLVYKALCLHPRASWISNYQRRLPWLPELAVACRLVRRDGDRRRRIWMGADGGSAYAYQRDRGRLEWAYPAPVEGEPVFARAGLRLDRPNTMDDVDAGRLRRSLARTARAGGGPVVSKRIGHNLRLPVLAEVLPGSRFVVVTRDGRAVADSLLRVDWWPTSLVWWFGGTPPEWEAEGGDPLELAARHWVEELDVVEAGLEQIDAARVLRVRYEDVIADAVPALVEMAAFGGLGPDAGWATELAELSYPDRNEAWRRRWTPEQAESVEAIQADHLRRHGYSAERSGG